MSANVQLDSKTKEWFSKQPSWMVTTCRKCDKCGLYYKSSLGHECEVSNEDN